MKEPFGGRNLDVAARLVIPFSMVYAIYVLAAGESSPGGGFQAGAVLSLCCLCARLLRGDKAKYVISGPMAVCFAGIGTFIYLLTGWLGMFNGGNFLDYGFLPFNMELPELHAMGITMIEIGVTICVMMTIITILETLLLREDFEV